jgi:hypothetical protein
MRQVRRRSCIIAVRGNPACGVPNRSRGACETRNIVIRLNLLQGPEGSAGRGGSGRVAPSRGDWAHTIFLRFDGQSALHLPERVRFVRSGKG